MNKIILIQLWLGKIPDYFWFHYETTKNLPIDFLFVTDQNVQLNNSNYKVIKKTKEDIELILKDKLKTDITIYNNRNVTILKPSLADLFCEDILEYDYFGYYDIDTLFGDFNYYIKDLFNEYDVISFGNEKFHNRTSGVLTIIKNTENNRLLYRKETNTFLHKLKDYQEDSFDEHEFNRLLVENHNVKILYNVSNNSSTNGKNIYECVWNGDKLTIDNKEKFIFHFHDKKNTYFEKIGNTIIGRYKKQLLDDFYWVTYFTESYEKNVIGLIESIKKYSNRKCILYTINYDSDLRLKLSEQFIVRRLDIPMGDFDKQGRDISVLSSKPLVLTDSIGYIPNGKFVYIDTDIYLTNVSDNLCGFIGELDNYPLMNSHIHDRLYANDIDTNREWVSTIDILSEETNIPVIVFPRRKSNIIIYDSKSKWFFEEQMQIYHKYKNTRPGIFRLHDEDSANILLSKYDFQKSLPLIDMEESTNLNFDKIKNYSYNISAISEHVKLPQNENEIYLFHGFKDEDFYKKIEDDYGNTVLDCEDIIIDYKENVVHFKKNSFLTNKKIDNKVDFLIKDKNGNTFDILKNQQIFKYWNFYLSNVFLSKGVYEIEIVESDSQRIIYKNLFKI